MKKLNLVVGSVFIWFGADKLIAENPDKVGWVLLVVGAIIILSAFSSSNGSGSNKGGYGGSTWDGSDGGDFGGGD